MVNNIVPVLSNVMFLFPSVQAAVLHRWTRAILYFLMIFVSGAYHLCLAFSACLFSAQFHRKLDFFYAQWLMPITALYLIYFAPAYAFVERWLIVLFGMGIALVEYQYDEPFALQLIVGGLSVLLILGYWVWYALQRGEFQLPPYDWENLALGLILTALACAMFATQKSWPAGYDWVHSLWHSVAALGQFFILRSRKAAPRDAAIDRLMRVSKKSRFI